LLLLFVPQWHLASRGYGHGSGFGGFNHYFDGFSNGFGFSGHGSGIGHGFGGVGEMVEHSNVGVGKMVHDHNLLTPNAIEAQRATTINFNMVDFYLINNNNNFTTI
jgi:hypothetical protein